MYSKFIKIFVLVSIFSVLYACGVGNAGWVDISSAEFSDSLIYSSRSGEITYELKTYDNPEECTVSFFLQSSARSSDTYYLGSEYIELTPGISTLSRTLNVNIDSVIPNGDYSLVGYISEMENSSASFTSSQAYSVSDANKDVTNVKITDIRLAEDVLTIDPSLDKSLASLPAGFDADNLDMLTAGMIPMHDINANATLQIEGPLPSGDIELAFDISIDNGVTWMPVELWNNEEQAYSDHINITFPGYAEGAFTQNVTILANITQSQLNQIFNNVNNSTDMTVAQQFLARQRISVDGVDSDSDDVYHFSLSIYPVEPVTQVASDEARGIVNFYTSQFAEKYSSMSKTLQIGTADVSVRPTADSEYLIYNNQGYIQGRPDTTPTGAWYRAGVDVPLNVFGISYGLLGAQAEVGTYLDKRFSGYRLQVNILGTNLVKTEASNISVTNLSLNLPLWSGMKDLKKKTVMVGPVPFGLKARVQADISAGAVVTLNSSTAELAKVRVPEAELGLYLTGGPDWSVVGFGVTSELVLLNDKLTANGKLQVAYNSSNEIISGTYSSSVADNVRSIEGKLGVYVKYRLFGKDHYINKWFVNTGALINHTYSLSAASGSL